MAFTDGLGNRSGPRHAIAAVNDQQPAACTGVCYELRKTKSLLVRHGNYLFFRVNWIVDRVYVIEAETQDLSPTSS